jgi:chorismate--pyruvate lyase
MQRPVAVETPMHHRDAYWQPWPVGADAAARAWLLHPGSLTARIVARCHDFDVRLLRQRRMRPSHDEARLLGLRSGEHALGRDVLLRCGTVPMVFAHSALRPADLDGPWRPVAGLGTRPLGAALFADPRIERLPMAFRRLNRGHPLYCAAVTAIGRVLPALWARRSIFVMRGAPLLVTEAFLPAIAGLPSGEANAP